jgi:hypothetical protein
VRGDGDEPRPADRAIQRKRELLWCAAALGVAVGLELIVAWFIRSKGVNLTGDEPSYIIQAQAYLHLNPHILSTVKSDLSENLLSAYPVGAPVSAVESFTGPQGMISAFEPGLGLVLVPFVATGRLFLGAVVGMLVLNTAGLILIHRRMTYLMGLRPRFQVLLALLLAAPALLVAMNQIYPDLPSGVLLACAIVEVAIVERNGKTSPFSSVVVVVAAAYLPWLQVKNLLLAFVVLLAFSFAARRSRNAWRTIGVVSTVCIVSWGILLAYNVHYFGHALGLPEPSPRVTKSGVEYTLGLIFDRDQGLLVQLPFVLFGLVGMWIARKKFPAAILATLVSVGGILVLNGTYTSHPYGGLSLAGRFMWTTIPVLIAWSAVVLARWQAAGRLLWGPFIVVLGAWTYQVAAILAGDHTYYNVFTQNPPWDPGSWPGWWPGFNRVLPQFDLPGHPLGAPAIALLIELALASVLVIGVWQYTKPGAFSKPSIVTMGGLGLVIVGALIFVKPLAPTATLSYDSAQLGAPVVGGDQPAESPVVNLQGVQPGSYQLTLSYSLADSAASGTMVISCNSTDGSSPQSVAASLPPDRHTASVVIECHDPGTVSAQLHTAPHSDLTVRSLQLRRDST